VKLPEKIEIYFTRIHDLPDFKPYWRRWQQKSAWCLNQAKKHIECIL